MKFYSYCEEKDNIKNGGTIVLVHHLHSIEELGHTSGGLITLQEEVPDDADWIIFQSEWYYHISPKLRRSRAKKICWLGHFKAISKYGFPDIKSIDADVFHTQWKGECVDWAEKEINKSIFYLPHGVCSCNTEGEKIEAPDVVFIGTNYPERKQDWLDNAGVERITCPHEQAKNYYKSAIVCPNLHGDFQKEKITEYMQTPGRMINDRIFNIIASGGFAISDNAPIVKEFFSEDEIPYAENKEEFKELIDYYRDNPEKREPFIKKAQEKIKNYTYKKHYKEFLKNL
jgi:hypothetical protein